MKKILVTIALAAVAVASVQAQGLVLFGNNNQSKVSTNSAVGGAATGVTAAAAGLYYYALFYSTTQTAVGGSTSGFAGTNSSYVFNSSGWTDSLLVGTNSGLTTGRFASSVNVDAGNNSTVNGLGTVATAQFVIIGWSANIGSNVVALASFLANTPVGMTGWFGESAVSGAIVTGNGTSQSTPGLMGNTGAPVIPGFFMGEVTNTVPEPGTIALAVLGGASLLAFRRKK
jgi:hypothetical protein